MAEAMGSCYGGATGVTFVTTIWLAIATRVAIIFTTNWIATGMALNTTICVGSR